MLQLIAYNQTNNAKHYLDVDANENISLNFSVSEIRDFSTRKSSRSNTFNLPFTETNNQFFTHFYNVNAVTGDFNIYSRTTCEIIVDGLNQLRGYLYIQSINLKSKTYEVVVVGETGELIDSLGEKKLEDLDETWQNGFVHQLSLNNITNSWDDNITYKVAGEDKSVIKYPMICWGINNDVWDKSPNPGGSVDADELKPTIKMMTVLNRIFAESGFSYDSNFFATSGFNIYNVYMTLGNESEKVKTRPLNYGFLAKPSTPQTINSLGQVDINYDTESYDPNNVWDTTASVFDAPIDGTYVFKVQTTIEFVRNDGIGETSATYAYILEVGGVNVFQSPNFVAAPASNGATITQSHTSFVPVNLGAFEVVNISIIALESTSGIALTTFRVIPSTGGTQTYIQLTQQPLGVINQDVYIQDNWPNITQKDFLKSIFEHFNMFVEPKQNNPNELVIDPYPIYMDRGINLDWTDKLDLSKELQIIPTTDFRNSKLNFQWSPDVNYLAKYRQEITKKNYGSYVYEDKSDLTLGEFKNFTVFGEPTNRLFYTDRSNSSNISLLVFMDLSARNSDGGVAPLKGKPRIAYFKKIDSGGAGFTITGNGGVVSPTQTSYGYYGHYSSLPATSGDFNLNFSDTYSGIYNFASLVEDVGVNNPYTQYWKQYMNEIYSDEARMLVGYFNLTPVDIHNLRFNNKIFVKDTFYRINSISNYTPNSQQSCKVELIKVFDAKEGLGNRCSLAIGSFSADGVVNFVNATTGVSATATKECCEAYGYTWSPNGEDPQCLWRVFSSDDNPFDFVGIDPEPGEG